MGAYLVSAGGAGGGGSIGQVKEVHAMTYEEWCDGPSWDAYQKSLEEDAARADARRSGKEVTTLSWGDVMDEGHYFCTPCWLSGDETGAHPYDTPPCDPVVPAGLR